MIKFTILLRRNPKLTHDEFVALHRAHAVLFTSLPNEVKQYIRRYVLSHPAGGRLPGIPETTFDGAVDFWFDDLRGLGAVLGSKEYLAAIRPDEENSRRSKVRIPSLNGNNRHWISYTDQM